jgi:hypothetical protein
MIPIETVKKLDLHCNDDGILCQVIDGSLVPYGLLINENDSHSNVDPIPDPTLASDPEPLDPLEHNYTREKIEAMDWREQKALCLSLKLPDKPQELTWEQYLLETFNNDAR